MIVRDRSVLTRRVHRLKDQEQRPTVLRVKHVLFCREPLGPALQEISRVALVHFQPAGVSRIEIL